MVVTFDIFGNSNLSTFLVHVVLTYTVLRYMHWVEEKGSASLGPTNEVVFARGVTDLDNVADGLVV